MGIEIRPIVEEELEAWQRPISAGFGFHTVDERQLEVERPVVEYDRFLGALDGGRFVAGAGAYSFDMTLPGGTTAPAAGVTAVAVAPTHTRRGILTGLMDRQLADVADRGEPFAVLNASEAGIYGRFGYGLATSVEATRIATDRSAARRAGFVIVESAAPSRYCWKRRSGLVLTRTCSSPGP